MAGGFNLLSLSLLGTFLYCLGVFGIITNRRSLLFLLISLELALLGLFLCFAFASLCGNVPIGQLLSMLILVAAASESAIGLALIILLYRTGGGLGVTRSRRLRG